MTILRGERGSILVYPYIHEALHPDNTFWRPFMKKRGYFSLVMLLITTTLFAVTDIGSAQELVITESSLAQAEQNTASTVSVITAEEIATYNAQSTAELVGKAIGVTYASYGSLGALQNVIIRGASSSKSLIFLNGVPLGSAHDGTVDLSIIPVQSIERIEAIKSGAGNLGRTNAIGGMVNIITKKGAETSTPFTLTVENGSFLPLAKNWLSLVDSQRVDLSYSNNNLFATVGTTIAQNAYLYDNNTTLRENAHLYEGHGSVSYTHEFSPELTFSTNNIINYKNLGTPGSASYPSLTDYMNDLLLTTSNTVNLNNPAAIIDALTIGAAYTYAQTSNRASYGDSDHKKHNVSLSTHAEWDTNNDDIALFSDLSYTLDYVDSTDAGKNTRHTISLASNASFYFLDGNLSLHPSANIAYLTDTKAFSPNGSIGLIYTPIKDLDLKASVSYAERIPTFSELYWLLDDYGYHGNPDLKTEQGVNAELGFTYNHSVVKWEGSLFGRNITNEITGDPVTYVPYNNAHSLYLGTEQTVSVAIMKDLDFSASYQYNKGFNLSGSNTLADNVELNVRKHTAKASLTYTYESIEAYLDAQYLGKTQYLDSVLLLNLSIGWQATESLRTYVAIDNLLNKSYDLTGYGYPMPGMKIRLGGSVSF
jgi:vitamin B12 transporter